MPSCYSERHHQKPDDCEQRYGHDSACADSRLFECAVDALLCDELRISSRGSSASSSPNCTMEEDVLEACEILWHTTNSSSLRCSAILFVHYVGLALSWANASRFLDVNDGVGFLGDAENDETEKECIWPMVA